MFCNVIVENKSNYIDNPFTYGTGDLDLEVGSCVTVPFGNREKEGYVLGITEDTELDENKIRDVISLNEDKSLNEEMIHTAIWMKQRYAIRLFDALSLFALPGTVRKRGTPKEPYKDIESRYIKPEALTKEQKIASLRLKEAINKDETAYFLIHGVTSSGKTEVYMEAIEESLKCGKGAIMLVPEISLTHQLIQRMSGRFGKENIAVLHSRLTKRERSDEWTRIKKGQARIVIGARMAVFAPLDKIGAIILDEEHEATYKADMTPKYDTHEVAAKRMMYHKGVMILGSATPSVASYERVKEGIYELIEMKERYNKTPLPKVEMVDMREELRSGNTSIFSRRLEEKLTEVMESGKQAILLQNRRGYSNFISCRECGKVMKCPVCGISLTYHKDSNSMNCHYCARTYPVPRTCPECGSKYIKYFGIGTEQVEEKARELFPNAVVDRLDIDRLKDRSELERILDDFGTGKTDILCGTQLVAKGLDFDNVGLVGVIAADTTLNIPDYRSEERTFQLITQVAGRAGRGSEQGCVIVQTYEPNNYAFKAAEEHDFEKFFEEESKIRSYLEYPPFGDIIMVNVTSDDEPEVEKVIMDLKEYMLKIVGPDNKRRVMNPQKAVNFKGRDAFRQYMIILSTRGKRNEYVHYLDQYRKKLMADRSPANITIDINPYSFF